MARTVEEVMTDNPRTVEPGATLAEAAGIMREADVGDVVVVEEGQVRGILTDRDIVVRAVADGLDPGSTNVTDAYTQDPATVTPDQSLDDAIRSMREQDIRRVPVVRDEQLVGILSLGDVAVEREPDSALADISASDPNN